MPGRPGEPGGSAMTRSGDAPLPGCPRPPVELFDVALLDLDGVVYRGDSQVRGAADAVARVRRAGMAVAFTTNNASRSPASVVERLAQVQVPAQESDVVTSGQAALTLLAEKVPAGSTVLALGSDELGVLLADAGWQVTRWAGPQVAAVVQGYSAGIGYPDLVEACLAIRAGALWVAGNTDATMPTERGLLPGNGALVAALVTATDQQPLVAGKPGPALHAEALRRTGASSPVVVGDRLDTDILGAVRSGTPSLLVMTGVTDVPALLDAPVDQRPTMISSDLSGLLRSHPAVQVEARRAVCGDMQATLMSSGSVVESVVVSVVVSEVDGGRAPAAGDGTATGADSDRRDRGLAALAALVWTAGEADSDLDRPELRAAALRAWDDLADGHPPR